MESIENLCAMCTHLMYKIYVSTYVSFTQLFEAREVLPDLSKFSTANVSHYTVVKLTIIYNKHIIISVIM